MPLWNPFKDKRVAIVGNDFSLYQGQLGHEIDNHDIVCRFDEGNEIIIPEIHGTKLDVAFFTYVIMYNEVIEHVLEFHDQAEIVHVTSKFRDHTDRIDHTAWDTMYNDECASELGIDHPDTVLLTLYYLSKCQPKSVDIYGLHFYNKPYRYYAFSTNDEEIEKNKLCAYAIIEKNNWNIKV
jgi:hypothetical protein